MRPSAQYLPLWLGKTRDPLASVCRSNPQQGIPSTPITNSHVTQGTNPCNRGTDKGVGFMGGIRTNPMIHIPCNWNLCILYPISSSSKTQYSTPQIIFLTQHEWSSISSSGCFFQTLLQPNSETHPVAYQKSTLGSYPTSKFSESHNIEAENLFSLTCLYRDNLHFIQGPSMAESIMEAIHIRTPHTKISLFITLSSSSSPTAMLLCYQLFLLPFDITVGFSSHLHGGEKLTS